MMKYIFKNSRGSALLAVMLVIAMVSIIGLGLLAAAFNNVRQASNTREFEKSYYDAENDLSKEVEALRLAVSAEYDSLLYYKQNDQTTYDSKFSTFYDDIKTGITDRMSKTASTGVNYSVTYTIYNSGDIGNEYAVYTLRVDTAKTSMNRFVDTTMDVKRLHIVANSSWDSEDAMYIDGGVTLSGKGSDKYDITIGGGTIGIPNDATNQEIKSITDILNGATLNAYDIKPWEIDFDNVIKDITDSGAAHITYSSGTTLGKKVDISNKIVIVKGNLTLDAAVATNSIIICTGDVTIKDYSSAQEELNKAYIFANNVTMEKNAYQGFGPDGMFVYTDHAFIYNGDSNASHNDIANLVVYSKGTASFGSFTTSYNGQIIALNAISFSSLKKDTTFTIDSDMVEYFYTHFPDYIPKPDFSDLTSSEESYSIPSGIISGSGKITETTK